MLEMIARDITAPYSAFEAWAYDRFIAPAVNDYVLELLAGQLQGVAADARVLDVGCGGGQNLHALGEAMPRATLVGLDLSPGQVKRATRRLRDLGERARVVQGSALELPFDDASFDVVLSIGSIKHWPEMAQGVSECARVLAPGGRLVIAEADRGCSLVDARAFIDRWRAPAVINTVVLAFFRTWVAGQGIDLEDARRLLAAAPLRDRSVERVTGAPFLIMRGVRVD